MWAKTRFPAATLARTRRKDNSFRAGVSISIVLETTVEAKEHSYEHFRWFSQPQSPSTV